MNRRTGVALLALVTLAACTGPPQTTIRVSAASSLAVSFGQLEVLFEQKHPDVDVQLNLAGSAQLREQILSGAPVDVLATADEVDMTELVEAGLTEGEVAHFATNDLVIGVPQGNSAGVSGLRDFARSDLLLGLCAPAVPCGRLAGAALQSAGVIPAAHTEEPNVRSLLTKLGEGELDAGIVYSTDVLTRDDVQGVPMPDEHNQTTVYPAVVIAGGSRQAAVLFVEFLLSDEAANVFEAYGFGRP